jgi:hypothetical protein
MKCIGCLSEIKDEKYTEINDKGEVLCPICTFVVAVYYENGVNKKFKDGDLALHKISNTVRKAVKELMVNPLEAYKKYTPTAVKRAKGIEIPDAMMKDILSDEFPFVRISPNQSEELNLKVGDLFRAHSKDGGFFRRTIVAMKAFTAKESKEHGYGRRAFVAYYVPAEA